jgi:hypothetical protein
MATVSAHFFQPAQLPDIGRMDDCTGSGVF